MENQWMERFAYHFEPKKGWMNDPNGLICYKGRYHAFFQHYPHAPRWGQMHWGHAVSQDLIHWEELPIALYPDQEYENDGGCFSGSAIEKDGRLYLFYTSVSHGRGQTQSVAYSDDGIHFTKYPGNPVIGKNPLGSADFRDPKVSMVDGTFYMVVGTGDAASGKVLLFTSEDLLRWDYVGILFEGEEYAGCIECPDFFKLGEKYVLMFSKINERERATHFVVGDFDGRQLLNCTISRPEWGGDFYAPQTFEAGNRRIMIGWMYHWGKEAPEGCAFAGALSIPRELSLVGRDVYNFPVAEAEQFLKKSSSYVCTEGDKLILRDRAGQETVRELSFIERVDILEDNKSVEVFVNGGAHSFTYWLI